MIKLYNTLSRKKEEFKPIIEGEVGLYTCGPTVYDYAHIGNLRTYIFEDILKRVLKYNGYKVKHIMNITDVGHLTGDMDMGEDKLEKGAKREGKTAWDIAKFYEEAFISDLEKLNIEMPDKWTHATKYIKEQIELIEVLEKKDFTYKISDGIYFDTSKFKEYNKLSHLDLDTLREGARVEKNDEKKNPTDFALWKFSPRDAKRDMEWESPWGIGFPGWHIECSAMSTKELRNQLDIHCGGIDHINVHHTNEIAQSECATGKQFFNYWMHGAFLNIVGGKKMSKSKENFLTVKNALIEKGYDPLVYRLMCLGTKYRKPMAWGGKRALDNFSIALNNIRLDYWRLKEATPDFNFNKIDAEEKSLPNLSELNKFEEAINNDMNMAVAWSEMYMLPRAAELNGGSLGNENVRYMILKMDEVIGLNLVNLKKTDIKMKEELENLPEEIIELKEAREKARAEKNFEESDRLRDEIENAGYIVEDNKDGMKIFKK